ncbi:YkgJ family cysteine cluster protein [Enhygromyxa salina]|uniref:Flagellin N-methylase n=1 Tax=Enhygromyxa salina TaxID=215803 RepID=A0A2S9YQJ5_9BACT|nr:YkgJ family cysteine cluster protein [Enhygromyxa salina]PRQ07375.1 Flagellin N-methylase [Enhygromyxa salina]
MSGSDHLVQLRARVDQHFEQAVARSPDSFACRAGCDRCCGQRFSVFEVEAAPIRAALAQLASADPPLRERIREQGRDLESSSCALLVDGRCSVYEQRPMICRSHGLPVAVADPERVDGPLRVDHCPLNFVESSPPRASVLILDAVNRPLAVIAELSAPGQPRVALADLAGS